MACSFDITVAHNQVRLDAQRRGEAAFTVFNRGDRARRGRLHLAVQDARIMPWLALGGDPERTFAVAGTEQVTVQIAVPATAPAGNYTFRLDMVGVDNPDEDFCSGPSVTFDVPAPAAAQPFPRWIVAAAVGALLVGVIVFMLLGRGPTAGQVAVPDVRNLPLQEAVNRLSAAGLTLGTVREGQGTSSDAGRVIATNPAPNAVVARNTPVNLTITPLPANARPLPRLTRLP